LRPALEAQAQALGIAARVHFTGELASPRNLHEAFDASVLCSLSEGFPNSLIEAMAAGRPVVATPVGGVIDAVTDGVNGMLVPLEDPRPLGEALGRLESDRALRERLGEAARETARSRYRRQAVIDRLSALYEALANRRAVPVGRCADA
jgi:glycosyltransferase involved in cell wall biosynthesis